MDVIFTISVVKCHRRLHCAKQFGLIVMVQKLTAKERRKAIVVPLLKEEFETTRILPENKKTSERR